MDSIRDRLTIGPADTDIKSVKDLQQLQQELFLRRIANGKQYASFSAPGALNPGYIKKKPSRGIATVKQPDQIGNSSRGGHPDIIFVVQPEDFQQPIEFFQVKFGE